MHIYIHAPHCTRIMQLAQQLTMRGYSANHASERKWAGATSGEHMQRDMMRQIAACDAVAVVQGELSAEQMCRLLVVCEFAGKPVVRYEDLPGEAPRDKHLPHVVQMNTRVSMADPENAVRPELSRHRIQLLLKRAARFFDHGSWLKNPNSREAMLRHRVN